MQTARYVQLVAEALPPEIALSKSNSRTASVVVNEPATPRDLSTSAVRMRTVLTHAAWVLYVLVRLG